MKAIDIVADGEGTRLAWNDAEEPVCGAEDVVIDVHATAINRADLMQRAGNYPPPPGASEILGLEASGVISEVGANAGPWKQGDRVCTLLSGGGYAERVSSPAAMVMPIPTGWDFGKAAALPEVFLTAFVNLFLEAGLRSGETALIHGGASGVGTAAIQLAKRSGCRVFATAGTAEKVDRCRALGADLAVNYHERKFDEAIAEVTGGRGVDVVLDMVGAPYLAGNLAVLNTGGRVVYISMLGGPVAEIDLRVVLGRRIRLIGSTLRSRPLDEKVEIRDQFLDRFRDDLENGSVAPVIDSVYPIDRVEDAHARMAANENIGKIVLSVRK